ncbi:MAG TPA: hypothetical protein DDY37_03740 [Legionella sp.]|nr:hypothetical protein [Legionella sp.]
MQKKQQMPRQINAPIYAYAEALYMAFYSKRLYVDVAKRWTGVGFVYFLLLIALLSIPLSIRAIVAFDQFFDDELVQPIKSIPALHFKKGALVFDKPMPYLVKSKSGKVNTVIDTTGTVSTKNNPYPELTLLITKNKYYFRLPAPVFSPTTATKENADGFDVQWFDKEDSSTFVASSWLQSSHVLWMKWLFIVSVYPSITAFIVGICFSLLMVLALLSQAFAWLVLRSRLTFYETARMLLVASTAPMTLFMILMAANGLFKGVGVVCVAILSVYFSYGVLSFKRERNQMVRA